MPKVIAHRSNFKRPLMALSSMFLVSGQPRSKLPDVLSPDCQLTAKCRLARYASGFDLVNDVVAYRMKYFCGAKNPGWRLSAWGTDLLRACCPPPAATIPPAAGRSEEHTSELQSLMRISYAVFCLKK